MLRSTDGLFVRFRELLLAIVNQLTELTRRLKGWHIVLVERDRLVECAVLGQLHGSRDDLPRGEAVPATLSSLVERYVSVSVPVRPVPAASVYP